MGVISPAAAPPKFQVSNHRLQSRFKIIPQEQEQLLQMVNSRLRLEHQHLLTISNYRIAENEGTIESMMCEQFQEVVLFFQQFDYYLSELEKVYPLRQDELEQIIFSVTDALVYLEKAPFKNRHGDISPRVICKTQKKWKLIDNCFIKGGLTAYEKALEHDQSFVSPAQMNLIRHGLFRESPPLSEGDDVFALGMTCLEIMTGRPSKNCYREYYIRFNQEYMEQSIKTMRQNFKKPICNLVEAMLEQDEAKRITFRGILNDPSISKLSNKVSLRNNSFASRVNRTEAPELNC